MIDDDTINAALLEYDEDMLSDYLDNKNTNKEYKWMPQPEDYDKGLKYGYVIIHLSETRW